MNPRSKTDPDLDAIGEESASAALEQVAHEALVHEVRKPLWLQRIQPPRTRKPVGLQSIYSPLESDTIRLVDLSEPSLCTDWTAPGSRIPTCSLRTLSTLPNPEFDSLYTAVSYTWIGEEYCWYGEKLSESTGMVINSLIFSLPSRVALILGYLFNMGIRTVWIDCLSINQDDVAERGQQVSRMNEIFNRATEVLVFLGSLAGRQIGR